MGGFKNFIEKQLNEGEEPTAKFDVVYTIECNDADEKIKTLLGFIQQVINAGESAEVMVNKDKKFDWVGDKEIKIESIKTKKIEEKEPEDKD